MTATATIARDELSAENIKRLLEAAGVQQKDIAAETGLSTQYVYMIVNWPGVNRNRKIEAEITRHTGLTFPPMKREAKKEA